MQITQFRNESLEVPFWRFFRKVLRIHGSQEGIDLDSTKTKAIQDMEPSKTVK